MGDFNCKYGVEIRACTKKMAGLPACYQDEDCPSDKEKELKKNLYRRYNPIKKYKEIYSERR